MRAAAIRNGSCYYYNDRFIKIEEMLQVAVFEEEKRGFTCVLQREHPMREKKEKRHIINLWVALRGAHGEQQK